MRYIHQKSRTEVFLDNNGFYVDEKQSMKIPSYIVENSIEWKKVILTPEKIKSIQLIPCLSIMDISEVYVTATKPNYNNHLCLESQGEKLLKLVIKKCNFNLVV